MNNVALKLYKLQTFRIANRRLFYVRNILFLYYFHFNFVDITEIQSWLFSHGMPDLRERLDPLVEASHLLQSRKDEANLETLCGEMTDKLKPKQVNT